MHREDNKLEHPVHPVVWQKGSSAFMGKGEWLWLGLSDGRATGLKWQGILSILVETCRPSALVLKPISHLSVIPFLFSPKGNACAMNKGGKRHHILVAEIRH